MSYSSHGSPFAFFIFLMFALMVLRLLARGRRGRGGMGGRPWGGPWGGGPSGRGPWGGGPYGGGPSWPGPYGGGSGRGSPQSGPPSGGSNPWQGAPAPQGWPGSPGGGTGGHWDNSWPGGSGGGMGRPSGASTAGGWPGTGTGTSSGGGWSGGGIGTGGGPAGGGWSGDGGMGGGPAGGGWSSSGTGGDEAVPAGEGRGAGGRLAGAGGAWPQQDERDFLSDPRPAAASIPGELFPERHAREVQAASPLDAGLAAIKAHDPNFDLEQFTQQAQRVFFLVEQAWSERAPEMARRVMADSLWQAHRAQIQAYIDADKRNMIDYLSVANIWPVAAHSDERFDTVTLRIVASCSDYDVDDRTGQVIRGDREIKPWEEDWTFQRSSAAETKVGGTALGSKCPNCGAPLDVDLAGTCRYCKAPIMSGDYDWVLARISQVG